MGLDTVELVMEIEEEFGLHFSDSEAQSCRTVGDVFDLILEKSPHLKRNGGCLSRVAFYRLRRACLPLLEVDREAFRPRTALSQLVAQDELPGLWAKLEAALGFDLPSLRRDDHFDRGARRSLLWFLGCFIAFVLTAAMHPLLAILFGVGAVYSLLYCLVCTALETRLPFDELPSDLVTVGDLASSIRWHYREEADTAARRELDTATEKAWNRLVTIICQQLAVKREQVTPEADIVIDLGSE